MSTVYGYCRISTKKQSIERQERNIIEQYPNAIIVKEVYTGTKFQGRKELEKILKKVVPGDTIVFDSVSRMSRNAEDGYKLYEELYKNDINLVFLKESYINTDTYKKTLDKKIELVGDKVDFILEGINKYLMELAKEQIRIAFEQAQKEVDDLHKRTSEGMKTAKLNGKQIGQVPGRKLNVKKSNIAKEIILKHSKSFNGTLNDDETIKLTGVSRKTYYKYKAELKEDIQ